MTTAQMSPQQIAQQNANNSAMLRATGLYMTKKLQPVTANALGTSIRIALDRIGIMTGVTLEFAVPVNVTAAATQSPFAPYNLIQQVTYTDFAGLQRINTSGWMLNALNSLRGGRFTDNSAKNMGYLTGAETGIDTNLLNVPTAVANGTMYFSLHLPMAVDPTADLRGAVLTQTITGDHYVTCQLANAFVGADTWAAPYSAGTMTLGAAGVTVTPYQHYIMPQNGVANLPMVDLSTIYAIEGNYTDSANIAAGQSKFINWPNNRAILSAMHVFDNGGSGVANGADLSQIILLGNSNTNIREYNPSLLRRMMRYHLGSDLPSGVYYLSSRRQPITTQLYGNVQTRFDVATANANPYFVSQYESTYLSGTPLPGIVQ